MSEPRPQSTRLAVLIPFAIVTLIWSGTWIVIRDQVGSVPASWSVTYRFAIAAAGMAGFGLYRRESFRLDRAGWRIVALTGLAQFCLNFNFVYRAEEYITSGLVAVTFAMLLIPNAALARIFLGQKMGRQLLAGSALAMAGIVLLFVHEARVAAAGSGAVLTGIGFTLCAILSASSANVLQATENARRLPLVPTLAFAMAIGAGLDALFALTFVGAPSFDPRPSYTIGLLYLGLLGSTLSFPLYFGVIRTIGPAKAAYSSVIVPVIAMLLSTAFEGYRWSLLAGAGAALAGIGLLIALTARRPNR